MRGFNFSSSGKARFVFLRLINRVSRIGPKMRAAIISNLFIASLYRFYGYFQHHDCYSIKAVGLGHCVFWIQDFLAIKIHLNIGAIRILKEDLPLVPRRRCSDNAVVQFGGL